MNLKPQNKTIKNNLYRENSGLMIGVFLCIFLGGDFYYRNSYNLHLHIFWEGEELRKNFIYTKKTPSRINGYGVFLFLSQQLSPKLLCTSGVEYNAYATDDALFLRSVHR